MDTEDTETRSNTKIQNRNKIQKVLSMLRSKSSLFKSTS